MFTHCILDVLAQLELTIDHTYVDTIVIILLSLVDSIVMSS